MPKSLLFITYIICSVAQAQIPEISQGKGDFEIEGRMGHEEKIISLYYYRPTSFTAESPVLFVIPGAGRNGWNYRDSWIEASEKYGVLILSPSYSESFYPEFWNYNIANMITDVELNSDRTDIAHYSLNTDRDSWNFNDFDRIFESVKSVLDFKAESYDMFGHSAGGQILHRLAMFKPDSKAKRIIAANSGWYTVPNQNVMFPYGVDGLLEEGQLERAFSSDLTVLLGQKDDRSESRGELARSPLIDIQGLSRIERGTYYFQQAARTAGDLGVDLNWKLQIVSGVGHDYVLMGKAAANLLYK